MAVYVWQQELEPGFPLAVIEYEVPGATDPMHWHDHLEIAQVLEGCGRFGLGGRSLAAEPGDVFFIDNSQPHVAHAAAGSTMRLLLVLFRPELIAGPGCRELDLGYLAAFRPDDPEISARVEGGTELAAELAPVLAELATLREPRRRSERLLADAKLREVLAVADRRRGSETTTTASRTAAARRDLIRPVLAHVEEHYREPITLQEVAEVVHVSPSRVRHVFKEVTGVGFKEYLTQLRVAQAKRLLISTELPVAEVAQAVSYSNLSQFYKVFYRSASISPADYRRYYTPAVGDTGTAQAL
jgi:AraC-like DNA-binding protein